MPAMTRATEHNDFAGTVAGLADYFGCVTLARILHVTVEELYDWSSGKSRPPANVLLPLSDLTRSAGKAPFADADRLPWCPGPDSNRHGLSAGRF